jgi:hypothetical protein
VNQFGRDQIPDFVEDKAAYRTCQRENDNGGVYLWLILSNFVSCFSDCFSSPRISAFNSPTEA